ncbi:MAG: hypothetical protein AB1442_01235 [Nitrospirota bacterium]
MSFHVTEEGGEAFIVVSVKTPNDAREAASLSYTQIGEVLTERRMVICHERIFGSLCVEDAVTEARSKALHEQHVPSNGSITYIEGNPPWGKGFAGTIIHAVRLKDMNDFWTIIDGNRPCGRGWRQNGIMHLILQSIQPPNEKRYQKISRSLQAHYMIERAERILRENGASYRDVVRTWFYLSNILDWYAVFNKARNEKYGEFGIMPGPGDRELLLPASTGIQAETPSGAACTMDLLAVLGGDGAEPSVRRLSNPSQLDAFRYGSAFARCSVVRNESICLIEVSGTAAIDKHGVSLYRGDIRAQIDCTLDKMQELLKQEAMELEDICSATVFVKQPEYAEIFYEVADARGLKDLPCVCILADVCRAELLFEMDAEVIVPKEVILKENGNENLWIRQFLSFPA